MKFIIFLAFISTASLQSIDWWKSANIYQISPISFKDSNNDGKGDIQGIISKLDYFKETGIDVILLSPFFQTTMVDYGYDVTNYLEIDSSFGTMSDIEELFFEAKWRSIRIILDFVPNHTSHKHEWFVKSEAGENAYKDFYIWHDGVPQANDGRPLRPNYWIAEYGGFSWKWSPLREAYYYHKFAEEQPDLNLAEERVLKELDKVLTFWLDKGADGFRIDAVSQLFEDSAFFERPDIEINLPQTYELIERWRKLVDNHLPQSDAKILIPQVWNSPIKDLMRYYQEDGKQRAQVPMNFMLINELNETSNAQDYKRVIDNYLRALPQGAIANWFLGTHDHHRVASRMGKERIDGLMVLLLTLPGISFVYYGDEIGMEDHTTISWEDTVDVQACNTDSESYYYVSRDVARTPFQWDNTANAGFTSGKSWLPVHPSYTENNLKSQMEATWSHYKLYKELLALKKNESFANGDFDLRALNENVLSYSRSRNGAAFIVAINLGNSSETVDLTVFNVNLREYSEVHLTATVSANKIGDIVDMKSLRLGPYDAVIVKYSSATKITLSLLTLMMVIVKLIL